MKHLDHPSPHFSDAKMARFLLHRCFWGTGDNCSIFVQDCSYLVQADVKGIVKDFCWWCYRYYKKKFFSKKKNVPSLRQECKNDTLFVLFETKMVRSIRLNTIPLEPCIPICIFLFVYLFIYLLCFYIARIREYHSEHGNEHSTMRRADLKQTGVISRYRGPNSRRTEQSKIIR